MADLRHDAEDNTQEVCCALVGRITGFNGKARFTTWPFGDRAEFVQLVRAAKTAQGLPAPQ